MYCCLAAAKRQNLNYRVLTIDNLRHERPMTGQRLDKEWRQSGQRLEAEYTWNRRRVEEEWTESGGCIPDHLRNQG